MENSAILEMIVIFALYLNMINQVITKTKIPSS